MIIWKRSSMSTQTEIRQQRILEALSEAGRMSVATLADTFETSSITIRRDLIALTELGLIKRNHGGAELTDSKLGLHITARHFEKMVLKKPKQKALIAEAAANMILDGQSVIIGNGTTTNLMAEHLANRAILVLTYSLPLITALQNSRCEILIPGGHLYKAQGAILSASDDFITDFAATHYFVGAHSVDMSGSREFDPLLVSVERRMAARSHQTIVLADSSKFQHPSGQLSLPLSNIDKIISDDQLSESHKHQLRSNNVDVICC